MNPADSAIAGYVFVSYLMNNGTAFKNLVKALREGHDFDMAFQAIYRGTPSDLAKRLMGGRSRGR